MQSMFSNSISFNQNINDWNVSNVTDMSHMFNNATSFNQNINNWNVSNVINMYYMFNRAHVFNKALNNWDVSNVISMCYMFSDAIAFNQNISNWNVKNDTSVDDMFCINSAIPFNKLKTTSFFGKLYKSMNSVKRKIIFDVLFHWDRRKNFIMFLFHYGYILKNTKRCLI